MKKLFREPTTKFRPGSEETLVDMSRCIVEVGASLMVDQTTHSIRFMLASDQFDAHLVSQTCMDLIDLGYASDVLANYNRGPDSHIATAWGIPRISDVSQYELTIYCYDELREMLEEFRTYHDF